MQITRCVRLFFALGAAVPSAAVPLYASDPPECGPLMLGYAYFPTQAALGCATLRYFVSTWASSIDWGGWQVVSAPGFVQARVLATCGTSSTFTDSPLCWPATSYGGVCPDSQTVSGDLVQEPLVADADTQVLPYFHTHGSECGIRNGGKVHVVKTDVWTSAYTETLNASFVGCTCYNTAYLRAVGTGIAIWNAANDVVLERVGTEDMTHTSVFTLSDDLYVATGANCYVACLGVRYGAYIQVAYTPGTAGGDQATLVNAGLIANGPETGDHNLYGMLADSGIQRTVYLDDVGEFGSLYDATTEGAVTTSRTFSDPAITRLRIVAGVRPVQAGALDINDDGVVNYDDRVAFGPSYGQSIGAVGYSPLADQNLDGSVDEADRSAFYAAMNGRTNPADFNLDDVQNPDDIGDFLTDYWGAQLRSDFNSDGVTDPDDVGDFLTVYYS